MIASLLLVDGLLARRVGKPVELATVPEIRPVPRPDIARSLRIPSLALWLLAGPMLWLCSDAAADVTGNRYVAARWDAELDPEQAARACAAPIAWPELAATPVWPGGRPGA